MAEVEATSRDAKVLPRFHQPEDGNCFEYPDGLTICFRGATYEVKRESAGELWCFGCRKRLPHDWVITADVEPSWYGPTIMRECSGCKQDRTAFPGFENNYYPEDW